MVINGEGRWGTVRDGEGILLAKPSESDARN
jgi:hypothetical protein